LLKASAALLPVSVITATRIRRDPCSRGPFSWPRMLLVHLLLLLLLLLALSVLGDPGDSPFSPLLAEGDTSLVTFESTRANATRACGACADEPLVVRLVQVDTQAGGTFRYIGL
jgi:hypothetical protein